MSYRPRLDPKLRKEYQLVFKKIRELGVTTTLSLLKENTSINEQKIESKNEITASTDNSKKLTLEEFAAIHEIDLNNVEVLSFGHKAWDMGIKNSKGEIETKKMFSTSGKFRKIKSLDFNKIKEDFLTDIKQRSFSDFNKIDVEDTFYFINKGTLLEICLFDAHINKRNYTLQNKNIFTPIKNTIVTAEKYGIDKILIVIGGDFFNIDNKQNSTYGNTPQDVEMSYENMIRKTLKEFTTLINDISVKYNIDILIIPGNHDKTTMFTFGEMLSIWYNNSNKVTIINDEKSRKYYKFGVNLLGFTHGDKSVNRLSNIMPIEAKEYWSGCKYYEWHIGHTHGQKIAPLKEENGIVVRTVSSLSGDDEWHYENGYIGNKQILESFIWDKEKGKIIEILK